MRLNLERTDGARAVPRLRAPVNLGRRLRAALLGDGPGRGWKAVRLSPAEAVARLSKTGFEAVTAAPWLKIDLDSPIPAGRWIRLRYGAGLLGDPVRPILRLARADGSAFDAIMPGPVCGWAVWTGRLPADCVGLSIGPVTRPGPFAFAVEGVRTLSPVGLLLGALVRSPRQALGALRERALRRRTRARHMMAAIWSASPLGDYDGWLSVREAGPPLAEPWTTGRAAAFRVAFVVDSRGADGAALRWTLASIDAQVGGSPGVVVLGPASGTLDRGVHAQADTVGQAVAVAAAQAEWIGAVRAGDLLAATALAALAEGVARDPDAALVYCDEDRIDAAGRRSDPVFKPDWSPRLQAAAPYLGGLTLVRSRVVGHLGGEPLDLPASLADAALASEAIRVAHLRRILLHRSAGRDGEAPRERATLASPAEAHVASVTAIIPTRDRLHLLQPCVEGLRRSTDYPALEIVIVDNGSEAAETRAYYNSLDFDPRIRILDRPGPFNFSALTNAGVAASRGELLLLLNNDIEVVRPGWLSLLVAEAVADVGAVGAKLLYPGGRVQHEGVVIGLGGAAGHIQRNRPEAGPDAPVRRGVPHEVSAVTGACMLVPRKKYEAVGGLDETRFPVSFNDIDLCLKLRRQGWRVILAPDAVLIHHESASRGRDDRGEKQARAEREAQLFAAEWSGVMRDDPYYHPALSLLRFEPALG